MAKYIKVQFMRGDQPGGREYTYGVTPFTPTIRVGDKVIIKEAEGDKEAQIGVCSAVGVPESEVESFKDRIKEVVGPLLDAHTVYSGFAFSKQELEIFPLHKALYEELTQKWRILRDDGSDFNADDYDLVYTRIAGNLSSDYHISKNATDLTDDQLALIFDDGNLCFGYSKNDDGSFHVYED